MPRIVGIDYGIKRTGISATDPFQIAVHPYKTVQTNELFDTLKNYFSTEEVELVVFGYPTNKDGSPTYLVKEINKFAERLKKEFPALKIDYEDEAYSSSEAKEIIIMSGAKKKKRKDKSMVDLVSAIIILQRYLKHIP